MNRRRRLIPDTGRSERRVRALRRARRWVRALTKLAAAAIVVEVGVLLFTSPLMAIRAVRVVGAGPEVNAWAKTTMSSAIGANVFRAPVGVLKSELSANPYVHSVRVSRRLPGMLVATVQERKPYVNVAWKSRYYLVDAECVPYRTMSAAQKGLPVLVVPAAGSPSLGKTWSSAYLASAFKCLEAARKRDMRVAKVTIDPSGDMCLNIVNSVEIRAGSPQNIDKKLWVASRFLMSQVVSPKTVDYVDVSCPGAPAFRPRGSAITTPVQ